MSHVTRTLTRGGLLLLLAADAQLLRRSARWPAQASAATSTPVTVGVRLTAALRHQPRAHRPRHPRADAGRRHHGRRPRLVLPHGRRAPALHNAASRHPARVARLLLLDDLRRERRHDSLDLPARTACSAPT